MSRICKRRWAPKTAAPKRQPRRVAENRQRHPLQELLEQMKER
ncbi:hypothetical protein [Ferrimonas marina]|uniref:Uncharacterized protein n=1 Tax=Ferrimonas marina TaxID=299255 RepID=A0A1M5P2M7_9GAMM|nr:hypothetical protein [Ferrimonas marina]SHG96061.1 hypothetical protein SAMN02745129_1268 [Ferrimonas marina]